MSNLETLTVEEIAMRKRNDGTGEFPVVIISGISINISESGSQSFTKRRISLPANGFTAEEAKAMFPSGMKLEGYKIEQYEVESYEWETPDGEVRIDNVRYRIVEIDSAIKSEKESTRPATAASSMESQVFAERNRTNELQPQ